MNTSDDDSRWKTTDLVCARCGGSTVQSRVWAYGTDHSRKMLYQCTECRCWWNDEGESGEWPTEEEHIERTVGVLRSLRMEPVAERLLALKARAEAAEKALHELTEPISDAGHTTADGLRHELQQVRARAEAAEKRVIELEAELDLATQHMSDMGTKP